jgi:5-methylcytosine-specific restriction endonuclease McrA
VSTEKPLTYNEYIQSDAWRRSDARLSELKAAEYRCRLCNAEATDGCPLEVHHRTYERLGRELPTDLTALCRECHKIVTSLLRARRYAITVPIHVDISLDDARTRLIDPTRGGVAP